MMTQMRRAVRSGVIGVCLVFALAGLAEAGTIRGRLVRQTPQGQYPAQGIQVTVYRSDLGQSSPSYSGTDGMYYLYNIPPGTYTLQIWAFPNMPPLTFSIQVGNQQFTDIAPIVVP